MRRYPFLACLLIIFIGAFPLLTCRGLPQGSDMAIHYWRTFALENSLNRGDIFGLWAEHFYAGYGSPIFQYQSPGFYVLAAVIGKLPFVDDVARLNLVWLLAIALSVFGVYGYAAPRWGAKTGLVCAASFVCAPAILFNEPIGRGSYPVSLATGCLALSLACLDRYAAEKRSGGLAALSLFGLLWSHNLTAVSGVGLLLAWFIWQAATNRRNLPYLRQAFIVFVLSGGLAAFFWMPLAAQRGAVQLEHLYAGENLNYQNYFQPLKLLLSPAARLDTGLYYQKERYSLGMASWVLAVGAGIGLIYRLIRRGGHSAAGGCNHVVYQNNSVISAGTRPASSVFMANTGPDNAGTDNAGTDNAGTDNAGVVPAQNTLVHPGSIRCNTLFWLFVAMLSLFLVLPQSRFIWDNLPAMHFFQFPPRFLNLTALALALSAGPCVAALLRRFRHVWLVLLALLMIQGWQSIPWRWLPDYPPEATAAGYFAYEMQSGAAGTTGTNEFLPASVVTLPGATSFVLDTLAANQPTLRLNWHSYPEGTTFEPLVSRPLEYVFRVHAPQPLKLEVFLFYFPGWQGEVDGQPVELRPSGDSGFIALDVVTGAHEVRLYYGLSSVRIGAIIVSLVCAALLAGWLWWQNMPGHQNGRGGPRPCNSTITRPDLIYFTTATALMLIGGMLAMRPGIAWVTSSPGEALLADRHYSGQFGDAVTLVGYDWLEVDEQQLRLALYWHFAPEVDTRLNSFVHVVDANGQIVAQQDKLHFVNVTLLPGWSFDLTHRDVYILDLPPDLPAAEYRLRVGLWRCVEDVSPEVCHQMKRIPAHSEDMTESGDFIFLPQMIRR